MRYRLVEMLACPDCGGDVRLNVLSTSQNNFGESAIHPRCQRFCAFHDRDVESLAESSIRCEACYSAEIDQGTLTCASCPAWFPIIDGIPRLLPLSLRDEVLMRYHPDWVRRYGPQQTDGVIDQSSSKRKDLVLSTIASFGFQWNAFSAMIPQWESNFRNYFGSLVTPPDFEGKNVLDAGCGFGRHPRDRGSLRSRGCRSGPQ